MQCYLDYQANMSNPRLQISNTTHTLRAQCLGFMIFELAIHTAVLMILLHVSFYCCVIHV